MNIYLYELKANSKSALIWTLSLLVVSMMFMSLYPGFMKDIANVKQIFESFPPELTKALGFNMEIFTLVLGYYSFVFTYIALIGSIMAMIYSLSVLSKETREKTADFLLSKPVTRTKIVTSKMLAVLTLILSVDIIYFIGAFSIINSVKNEPFSFRVYLLLSLTLFIIQLFFYGIGFLISVIAKKIKNVISISLSTVFFFFISGMLSSVIGEKTIRYITPFAYFDNAYIITQGRIQIHYLIPLFLNLILSVFFAYYAYNKKDIHSV